jgi:hypothetical protein
MNLLELIRSWLLIFIWKIYTITNNLLNFGVKRVQIIFHAMIPLVIVRLIKMGSLANGHRSVSGRVCMLL